MLYITTALYIEAQPFIHAYQLRPNSEFSKFQVFSNEHIYLIITGTGELKASITVTYLLSQLVITPQDLLLNFGMCAAMDHSILLGTAYQVHQLHHSSTNRDLYPDCVIHTPYSECSLETCPQVVGQSYKRSTVTGFLADMEGYAIMYAGTYFLQPHQFLFIKVVSDYGEADPAPIDSSLLKRLLANAVVGLMDYLTLHFPDYAFFPQTLTTIALSKPEQTAMEQLSTYLHLSETMRFVLKQHILYCKSQKHDAKTILEQSLTNPDILACKSKTEGKQYFEQLKSRLME